MGRTITYAQAVNEAIRLCMAEDPVIYVMGLGVPDPRGVFGTTKGLLERFGPQRVMDMPCSENAFTGIATGSALVGMRPIVTHQRLDFALLAMEQIVGQAANWRYMFGGGLSVPIVIRLIVGRGWGQGPQHSQSLQAWFAHIPGLKVVMPATAYDAKGLLISSIEDNNPVIFIEHRWLHNVTGEVPEETYRVPIGRAKVIREGTDVTIVSVSLMTLEAHKAAEMLSTDGISVEIVDVRTLRPFDKKTVIGSVEKTGRLIVADTAWKTVGFAAEVIASVAENAHDKLECAPVRIGLPDCPSPTSRALANYYYPRANDIAAAVRTMLGKPLKPSEPIDSGAFLDVPDSDFRGPF